MGGLANASSASERLSPPSRFSTDGNSYGVRLANRNRCATFTNRQVANIARRRVRGSAAYRHQPADDYCFTGVAGTLAGRFSALQV
jgi:hypothetical protein